MKYYNKRFLQEMNLKRKGGDVECAIRSLEVRLGLAPEDSINYNPYYDSEENDPENW
jgi:hypothetical protein